MPCQSRKCLSHQPIIYSIFLATCVMAIDLPEKLQRLFLFFITLKRFTIFFFYLVNNFFFLSFFHFFPKKNSADYKNQPMIPSPSFQSGILQKQLNVKVTTSETCLDNNCCKTHF